MKQYLDEGANQGSIQKPGPGEGAHPAGAYGNIEPMLSDSHGNQQYFQYNVAATHENLINDQESFQLLKSLGNEGHPVYFNKTNSDTNLITVEENLEAPHAKAP